MEKIPNEKVVSQKINETVVHSGFLELPFQDQFRILGALVSTMISNNAKPGCNVELSKMFCQKLLSVAMQEDREPHGNA